MSDYNIYTLIGEDEGVQELVKRFYDYMEQLPEARTIRQMHPRDLRSAREKLFMFLSGWMGGPDRYIAAFGHPRLRARHLPFAIGTAERDAWLLCMARALEDMNLNQALRMHLMASFTNTANHMMNQQQPPPAS